MRERGTSSSLEAAAVIVAVLATFAVFFVSFLFAPFIVLAAFYFLMRLMERRDRRRGDGA